MTEIGFYHLQRTTVQEALPRLLEKALEAGYRAIVKVPTEAEAERLAVALWTYSADSFLPHGTAQDGWSSEQPIFLTSADENPNGADLVCQLGGSEAVAIAGFKRALDLFDGNDPDAVGAARERWKRYQQGGHSLSYWQQKPGGGWERKT